MPMMSMASPCNVAFDAPNGFRAIFIESDTIAVVIADDVSIKLAPVNPLRCTVMLLATGTVVAEDRERMGGWQSCVIWAPDGSYSDEDFDQTAAMPG
jgi:hypothetical protein